ncbi:cation transporter [Pedobacter psychroterrae]|uniref:Cation transporter n=2 Tax=Pedobacter psychroterrae TaxID=2530453 RepID=A0A4R0NNS5_9SPHI|nr:cation transporter [Pedobacter psychroterrae]
MGAKLNNLQPKKKAILIALCISILLMLAKFVAYFITHSNAILTDAAESIVNVLASSFAFYSIYLATVPKDTNHPYGHGKVEYFSAFLEGALITIAGVIIIFKSGYDLIYPKPILKLFEGAAIIGFTGFINMLVGYYLINTGKQQNSITLEADGKHLLTDAVTSAGLVVGVIMIKLTGMYWLDGVISILLGVYIIYNGYKLTRRSVGGLMDESDIELVKDIIDCMQKNRRAPWIDVHNLRAQQYGADLHIDCHFTLPYYFDLNHVHQEISAIDHIINGNAKRKTELFIHADPCLPACCNYCHMKACPVRSEPFSDEIKWTIENATKNQKHFDQ